MGDTGLERAGETGLERAGAPTVEQSPLKIVRPPNRIDGARLALFVGESLPISLLWALLYAAVTGVAFIVLGGVVMAVLASTQRVPPAGAYSAGWLVAGCGVVAGFAYGLANGLRAFLETNPLVVAPEARLKMPDWNQIARRASMGFGTCMFLGSLVASFIAYARDWPPAAVASVEQSDLAYWFRAAMVAGVVIAVVGLLLCPPSEDREKGEPSVDEPGYRSIFRFDRVDFEQRAGGMSQADLIEALRKDVEADSCETWWSDRIGAQVVVFRWFGLPTQEVRRRLANVPRDLVYGRELQLLYFGPGRPSDL